MNLDEDGVYATDFFEPTTEMMYIRDSYGVASLKDVKILMEACASHLNLFKTQDEADAENGKVLISDFAYHAYEFNSRLNKRSRAAGFIYLMRSGATGLTKIGFSKNPKFRESTLQAEDPAIELIHAWKSEAFVEQELHEHFRNKRQRGEWFKLSNVDIKCIGEAVTL